MRDTIDFGIDLGTTNSAIAVVRDGSASVIKNNENWDYTPSAVWIPKQGVTYVGRRARDRLAADMANAHAEFKQEMGLDGAARFFREAGVPMTPQQLSAEVLKSLRADAAHVLGEPPQAAVITVPAAFRLHQNNATGEAAALAGFGNCPLVQEPTAAAFAFGFQNESTDACWMVFDFGGGTFDSAVVSTHEGELRVLDHAGDPHLGGKLIDWAIVERLLVPAVVAELGLRDLRRDNPVWQRNFAVLKAAAEDAKIELSRTGNTELLIDLDVGGGDQRVFEHTLRRDDIDRVAEPFYLRAINLCREALTKAGLGPADVDKLLLVGGTTLAPALRERLADPVEGLGIELDHSQDPTTVVARGAAVFASTVPLDRPKTRPVEGEFGVDLRYPRNTSLTLVPVQGRFESTTEQDWARFHVVLDNANGMPPFRTPQVSLDAQGTFVTEVLVDERATSTFDVLLVDPAGARRKVNPATASITHVRNELGGQVLTNSLGLSEADGTFTPILHKGSRLPAVARSTFYTTIALHRTDSDAVIRIPLVEGERARADRNLRIGLIEIRPKDVRIDLPGDSEVEITIEVDESRRVTVVADVPLVDEQFEAEIDLSRVRPPVAADLERELREVHGRLAALRENRRVSAVARRKLDRLEGEQVLDTARDEVRAAATDPGSAAAADHRLRDIQAVLDEVEEEDQLNGLLAELDDEIKQCRDLLDRKGAADDLLELADIERRAADVRGNPDSATVDELIGRAVHLSTSVMRRDETFDIALFQHFRDNMGRMTQPMRARALIAEGNMAIAQQNWRLLPEINQELRKLWPVGAPERSPGGVRSQNGRQR
ncbi:molecular chaperone DnaK [Lentzea albidocapillata subsp. violacea]|uniref:Molecular chaperone DnaK n=1 Tax=Lentzea albidocapillata subsp. violacea TaxID=128104 RepID=A0A1G8YEF3_9PSEU|nr:Hsp70 family protein [Lentzea albidocapillata]SDK01057.1 molecular chaperone DnaK [Lentzea albidocapillata subsp. violacea]